MTTLVGVWHDVAPVRGALADIDLGDSSVWAHRLRSDRERAERNQTADLAAITAVVEARSRELGAQAVILSGSTARGRRTLVSDLDYHVIGARPDVSDLPEDIDLYTDEPGSFTRKLKLGDDFAHWSVWYGCVLFDSGVVRAGAALVARHDLWPDPARKLRQALSSLGFAERVTASGDYDAALEQARGALSLTARWHLLEHGVFPLARDELSGQLHELGQPKLAETLHLCIHQRPPASRLLAALLDARALTEARAPAGRLRRPSGAPRRPANLST